MATIRNGDRWAWSTFGPHPIGAERFVAVSSGRSFAQVAGAILRKQAQGQNPDKDEVPGSSPGRPTSHSRMGELCALQPLRYSLGHGIAIAPCAPMARVHPALQPRGPRRSILRHALPAQLCLPNLWRPGCDLGARTPHRLARQDRRMTYCRASFRRLANEAVVTIDRLTQRSRWEPTAPPGCRSPEWPCHQRAIHSGPDRSRADNHGQHPSALDLRCSLASQVTTAPDLALQQVVSGTVQTLEPGQRPWCL